jgi:hypothetical protein
MARKQIDLLQGTLHLLVLKSLAPGRLTAARRRQLETETQDWQRISSAITSALKAT